MKKYISKIFCTCIFLFASMVFISCSDLLHQEPQGVWTDEDNKGGSFAADIFSMYAKTRGFHVTTGNTALAVHNVRCEDVEKGSTESDGAAWAPMFDDFTYNASQSMLQTYWASNYEIVHIANDVLNNIKIVEAEGPLSEGTLINRSEAHFFRAFIYFNLVRAFGEVPLIDFPLTDLIQGNVPKSSVAQIYELIDSDLTEAAKHLPLTWGTQYPGRLTWGAAKSLHAKTYMQRNDWNNMLTLANEVINSGIYNLDTPFEEIFRETGENCSESIWELQCTATDELKGSNEIGSQYAAVQGVRGAGEWNLGWGQCTPTENLGNAFEPGDPRKDETLLYFYRTNEDASICPANKPWNEKPVANAAVINKYYNKKCYTNPALRARYTTGGYWVNVRMIRLPEVLLIGAEAANELGQTDLALDYLEQVRARARKSSVDPSVLPEVTVRDKAALREKIKHERRIELAMEWDRFYDLVRWGDAQSVLGAAGKNYLPKHQYLPLPQAEVDKSNGVLVQNPNY